MYGKSASVGGASMTPSSVAVVCAVIEVIRVRPPAVAQLIAEDEIGAPRDLTRGRARRTRSTRHRRLSRLPSSSPHLETLGVRNPFPIRARALAKCPERFRVEDELVELDQAIASHGGAGRGVEPVDLADLLVEQRRGRETAQLA